MDSFQITGPTRLEGRISAGGAKNAALPALAATLLTDQPVRLQNLPRVRDVRTMEKLLEHLGVSVERSTTEEPDSVTFTAAGEPEGPDAPYDLVKTMRASVLILGPSVARRGRARVSLPGGCAIGVRPIDQHLAGLEALGARITLEHGYVDARAGRLRGARFRFRQPTVGGTENVVMAATLADGSTVLENCAREPEIVDLCRLLRALGAHIEGDGTSRIEIEGVPTLGGGSHRVLGDRIEAGTYLLAGAITAGRVRVDDIEPATLEPLLEKLDQTGCHLETTPTSISVERDGELRPRDLETAPHPGFPTDLQAQYLALMTQARGPSTIHETVFENRFQHVPELNRMGARVAVEGPFARVSGPTALSGSSVMATDLRASACLVMAGLVADGQTIVGRIYHLDRGYAAMESKLQKLGADVRRVV